jgi:CRP-like cAMP-binding protein
VRERLVAGSRVRTIQPGDLLAMVGDDVNETYFPTTATLSILAEPDEATIVEASTVGREGAADVFAAIGALKSAHRLIGQVPGDAIVLEAKAVRDEVGVPGRTQTLIFSYIQALYAQAAISAACNVKHHIEQRAARWLLQTHDRAGGDTFELKQEFLAVMLGAARPVVSLAAAALRGGGPSRLHARRRHGPRSGRSRSQGVLVLRADPAPVLPRRPAVGLLSTLPPAVAHWTPWTTSDCWSGPSRP